MVILNILYKDLYIGVFLEELFFLFIILIFWGKEIYFKIGKYFFNKERF